MLVCDHIHFLLVLAGKEQTSLLDEMLVSLLLMLSGMFFSSAGGWLLCWVAVGFHVWLVTSICKVEGYTKEVNDFFVGIDCNL